jgi:UDP-N-acetylglucosamine 3-dehydrogenase
MHATRNLPATISAGVLDKISPLMGDGIHDTDVMLWLTESKIGTVYAQNVRVRDFKYPDLGWAMYRFESGAVGVIETIWFLPATTPFTIDARMEIIGTEGAIYLDCGNAGLEINEGQGLRKPDTMYWPKLHGSSVGVLRNELAYFVKCLSEGKRPTVVTPVEAREAVAVVCAAERSAASGQAVTI